MTKIIQLKMLRFVFISLLNYPPTVLYYIFPNILRDWSSLREMKLRGLSVGGYLCFSLLSLDPHVDIKKIFDFT